VGLGIVRSKGLRIGRWVGYGMRREVLMLGWRHWYVGIELRAGCKRLHSWIEGRKCNAVPE
jgi:hypothetical protein